MTGFASAKGQHGAFSWSWELRAVNAKGLDLRLRVPDWVEGLEAGLRMRLSKALGRGSVALNLRLVRDDAGGQVAVNAAHLAVVLEAMAQVEAEAMERGLSLAPANAADIVALRGVLDTVSLEQDNTALLKELLKGFEPLLAAFLEMRASEGRALEAVLSDQLDQIATLTQAAAEAAEARKEEQAETFRAALARVLENSSGADEQRVAQELAMLAVKADVTEEIDRLRAHITAARDLLEAKGPVGRKLDFLSQEFNREANTLCSKANSTGLSAVGLELKAVIDQMREQVQNVE